MMMSIPDGLSEVYKVTVARQALRDYTTFNRLFPAHHSPAHARRCARYAKNLVAIKAGWEATSG
jgi:hypothetical protein